MVSQLWVIGCHHAAVSRSTEIFGWVETETARSAQAADVSAPVAGADGLSCIFDHRQSVRLCGLQDGIEVGRESKQMNGQDGARSAADRGLDQVGVEVEGIRPDVDEDGPRSRPSYRTGCGDKCERRRDDLVTRTDAERIERQQQGVRPGRAAHGGASADHRSDLVLERLDFLAQDEPLVLEDA